MERTATLVRTLLDWLVAVEHLYFSHAALQSRTCAVRDMPLLWAPAPMCAAHLYFALLLYLKLEPGWLFVPPAGAAVLRMVHVMALPSHVLIIGQDYPYQSTLKLA
jgi:hypothetical protein